VRRDGGGELLRPERAPHRCVADELDAQGGDLRDAVMALAHLRIDLLTTQALLEELAAGLGAFVDDRNAGTAQRRCARRRESRGARTDHQKLRPRDDRRWRSNARRRWHGRAIVLRRHDHAIDRHLHARTPARRAVDADDALLAHADAAEDRPRRPVAAPAK
jgi:hypothetical protein